MFHFNPLAALVQLGVCIRHLFPHCRPCVLRRKVPNFVGLSTSAVAIVASHRFHSTLGIKMFTRIKIDVSKPSSRIYPFKAARRGFSGRLESFFFMTILSEVVWKQ